MAPGVTNSAVASATYTIRRGYPGVHSPGRDLYSAQSVTIFDATTGQPFTTPPMEQRRPLHPPCTPAQLRYGHKPSRPSRGPGSDQ